MTSTIGGFEIGPSLGRGGMGEVFEAFDPHLGRKVAVKRIRPGLLDEERAVARFRREARLAARLNHPAIVQVYAWVEGQPDDSPTPDGYLVLELVEGQTLWQALDAGPLSLRRGLALAQTIAEALDYAHRQGVLHRDLKAENVLLDLQGQPKISDFGLAVLVGEAEAETRLTRTGFTPGTRRSMSPEQALAQPLDARSDLFSFGVLLYEVFTGSTPFRGASDTETLIQLVQKEHRSAAELRPELPVELVDLIDQLLEKKPDLRPPDAREVAERLAAVRASMEGSGEATFFDGQSAAAADAVPSDAGSEEATRLRRRDSAAHAESAETEGAPPLRPSWLLLLGAGLLALLALWALARSQGTALSPEDSPAPLRIAVVDVENESAEDDPGLGLLIFALEHEIRQTLLAAPTLQVSRVRRAEDPAEILRRYAADELLAVELRCPSEMCFARLERRLAPAGETVWTSEILELPWSLPLTAARSVSTALREAYSHHFVAVAGARPEPSSADYARYLELLRSFKARAPDFEPSPALADLDGILRRSPEFVEADLLAAEIHLAVFESQGVAEESRRARQRLAAAVSQAPRDREVLFKKSFIELALGDLDAARQTLAVAAEVAPGDTRLLSREAAVREAEGRPLEALELRRKAAARHPSCSRLYSLGRVAIELGERTIAQEAILGLRQRCPGDRGGRLLAATWQLIHGSPQGALEAWWELGGESPSPAIVLNQAMSQLLAGDPAGAAARIAPLAKGSEDPTLLANFADGLYLSGRRQEALEIYGEVATLLRGDPGGRDSAAGDPASTLLAQALAHLGEPVAAAEAVEAALRRQPEGSQAAFDAALTFAVIGDYASALGHLRRARAKGWSPAWFCLGWFDELRAHPRYGPEVEELAGGCPLETDPPEAGPSDAGPASPRASDASPDARL